MTVAEESDSSSGRGWTLVRAVGAPPSRSFSSERTGTQESGPQCRPLSPLLQVSSLINSCTMIVVLLLWLNMATGERTVLVTPRPRWLPTKFTYEPKVDPSNPGIPALIPIRRPIYNLRVISAGPNSILSATLPLEHRHEQKPSEVIVQSVPVHRLASPFVPSSILNKPIVVAPQRAITLQPIMVPNQTPTGFSQQPIIVASPSHQTQRNPNTISFQRARPHNDEANSVYVESVPSLSVNLKEKPQLTQGLADYLTPPSEDFRYSSVYQDERVEPKDSSKTTNKKKTNKKKKPKPEDTKENDEDISEPKNHKFKSQSSGERIEFQLHGQNGPESYKFGFDTGAGIDNLGTKKKTPKET